ncbi:MAG: DUF2946 domain-containing protein [Planctomycetes bacterium]|nr:DUF2946 family protein [Phycisphaerae bacterium]NBB95164.1 DUF2946 domain-containing protein [Planctomycetota bacterium]
MLAVIALQGTGLLHAIHLAVEHAPPTGHGCESGHCGHDHGGSQSTHPDGKAVLSLDDGQDSGHGHGHYHDPATCPICQMLASLWAISVAPSAGLSASLPTTYQVAAPESLPLTQIALATLGPRAPPEC